MSVLQNRLQNCLATIIEIQPCLTRNFRISLASDFAQLQHFLNSLEGMALAEEDVERMERLTAAFLRQAAMACARPIQPSGRIQ